MTKKLCPLTYLPLKAKEKYAKEGLKLLSPKLKVLHDLAMNSEQLRRSSLQMADKLSIQGVQPKLSARLNLQEGKFVIAEKRGRYILKLPSLDYAHLPENEDLTMRLAKITGITVPLHGLIYAADKNMVYWVKRFDRKSQKTKIALEDFAQLAGLTRQTKYQSSMEQVANIVKEYTSFPKVELSKLFRLVLFNFISGNEDAHLKNFSLIHSDNKVSLSLAYDLLNTTIALKDATEEIALPLNGKKRKLTKKDFVDYYAQQKLGLNKQIIEQILSSIKDSLREWKPWINKSFLTAELKENYIKVVQERALRLRF